MLGQPVSMLIPEVVGFKLTGAMAEGITATDLVLTCVQMLREVGVVGRFVEFYGPGVSNLSLADRATIANMAPEYGATCGFFGIDDKTLDYMRLTGRPEESIALVEAYAKEQGMWFTPENEPVFTNTLSLDMGAVVPFVLWFNFTAGFVYIAAGIGLWRGAEWAPALSLVIAIATSAVLLAFLGHVWNGGPYEARTMGAMSLRLLVWTVIARLAFRSRRRLARR